MIKHMPNYPNPPIVEAIIELQFPSFFAGAVELNSRLNDKFEALGYTESRRIKQMTFATQEDGEPTGPAPSSQVVGLQYRDEHHRKVFQVREDKLVFSLLGKYKRWDELKSGARRIFDVVKDEAIDNGHYSCWRALYQQHRHTER